MEKKLTYWLLTTEFPPQFGGGIGTYCAQWCAVLQQHGVAVTVFIPDKAQSGFKKSIQDGITVVTFSPYFSNTASFLGYETMISYSFAAVVEQFMKTEGVPDWLEAQEYNGIAYYILQKKQLGYELFKNLNVLITCHCPSFFTFYHNHINTSQLPYFWIGEMERFSIKAADVCITPSHYLANQLVQAYPSLSRSYHVVRNPYASPYQTEAPQAFRNEVVFIGKLSPAKGILQTLKTFSRLWTQGHAVTLKLIGDETYYYHAAASTMGAYLKKKYGHFIEQGLLQLRGVLPPQQLKGEVVAARAVIMPSTIENLPYTVVECMAAEKVVLASAQGGQTELIQDGVNGFLFDHNSTDSFFDKLVFVLSLPHGALKKLGKRAAETIQQLCDPQAVFAAKMDVLNSYDATNVGARAYPFIRDIAIPKTAIQNSDTGVKDLLSVIIPYYNLGNYIDETVHAIEASDYTNIEIIIVDDGSSEAQSLAALKKHGQNKKIRVVAQQNEGLPKARNRGVYEAKGEFMAFLDADDKIAPTYYSKAIALLQQKENIHFVGSWVRYFDGAEAVWPAFDPEPPYLLFHNMVNSSGLVYRRSSFLQAGLNDAQFVYGMEDYDSVISLVKNGYRGVVVPEPLFLYRVRNDSMARGFNKSNMTYLYQLLAQKHTGFYATFAAEITDLLNANGPGYQYENPTLDYHVHPGNTFYDRMIRKLMVQVKQQPVLRKVALRIYKTLKS